MYTVIIALLVIAAIYIITGNWELYRSKTFLAWLCISCAVGWIEFFCFLRHGAWIFSNTHILGVKIAGVTIEDILFCPCFSVLFFKLYKDSKNLFKQRVFNPSDKLGFAIAAGSLALLYYDIGSQFSKYMALRTALGFIGLIYCWNTASFRHSIFFMLIVYIIGFGWDLPSVGVGVWSYITDIANIPKIYDGMYLNILGALFPIELFGYYITGGFFSFWMIAFCESYFEKQYKL